MSAPQSSSVLQEIAAVRKDLGEKRDRIRGELAALGNEPRRLSGDKRSVFSSCAYALHLLDELEAQVLAGGADDVPGTLGQLIALLKDLQKLTLPGTATPAQGTSLSAQKAAAGTLGARPSGEHPLAPRPAAPAKTPPAAAKAPSPSAKPRNP